MSDLDRLIKLAGLAANEVAEGSYNETITVCKDCGDRPHMPTTNCPHDCNDENGDHWIEVDVDGDGDTDVKIARDMKEDAFDKVDRITDPQELNLYDEEDMKAATNMSAEELKDELEQDIYHLMDMAADDFTDNDHIADEMGDYFANMHMKGDDASLSCYAAMRDMIDEDPAVVYETGAKCLKILGAQPHEDNVKGKMESELATIRSRAGLPEVAETKSDEDKTEEPIEETSKLNEVKLAGNSIWDREGKNPKEVEILGYTVHNPYEDEPEEDDGYRSVTVEHDGPWTIYTDSAFENWISDLVEFDVEWSEQGMQEDGMAHLEGYTEPGSDFDEGASVQQQSEAVGAAADPIMDLCDDIGCDPNHPIFQELVRYLDGDQIADFVEDFRRNHDMNSMESVDYVLESAAKRAVKSTLIEDKFDNHKKNVLTKIGQILNVLEEQIYELHTSDTQEDATGAGDLTDQIATMDKLMSQFEGVLDRSKKIIPENMDEADVDENNAFNDAAATAKKAGKSHFMFNGKKYKVTMDDKTATALTDESVTEGEKTVKNCGCGQDPCKTYGSKKESIEEAPTMDTTQLITLLKNAGLSEEAIEKKITEWANTPAPDLAGEQEPTEHGDAYDFAQNVNLSLKRYLDAEDMKVGLKEHKVEDIKAAYKAKKQNNN